MKKRSMWSLKLSTATLVLIPAAVGINYIGKAFAEALKLPLWLDSIGTILASMLAGPIAGAIGGAINNIIYGLTLSPISFIYAATSVAIGLVVGVLAYKGWVKNIARAVILGLIVALVSAVVSTPINIAIYGGTTGNFWGDAVFAYFTAHGSPMFIASFIDEILVDLPDKLVVVIISFFIFKGLPKKLTILYSNDNEIEEL